METRSDLITDAPPSRVPAAILPSAALWGGTGFSRAVNKGLNHSPLASEAGLSSCSNRIAAVLHSRCATRPQRLKPDILRATLTARLKPTAFPKPCATARRWLRWM